MKKFIIIILAINNIYSYAHDGIIHKRIAYKARDILKYYFPCQSQWNWLDTQLDGGDIEFALTDEDEHDLVYGYEGYWTTITHFVDLDNFENHVYACGGYQNVPNAWTKARAFLFGAERINLVYPKLVNNVILIYKDVIGYSSLVYFYNTAHCQYISRTITTPTGIVLSSTNCTNCQYPEPEIQNKLLSNY